MYCPKVVSAETFTGYREHHQAVMILTLSDQTGDPTSPC